MPESAESLPEPLSEVLPGRVAVVTGASRGIGAMTARALAGDGYAVCMLARDGSAGGKVADEIRSRGQSAAMARSADIAMGPLLRSRAIFRSRGGHKSLVATCMPA